MTTKTRTRRKPFGTPKLALNSEGEAFEFVRPGKPLEFVPEWVPSNAAERVLLSLWEEGMKHFRNWRHGAGEPFSSTKTCWMPAARLDAEPCLILAAEFGAKGNELNDREGLPTARRLESELRMLVTESLAPKGVRADVVKTGKAYFEVVLTAPTGAADASIAYAKKLSEAIEANKLLAHAHEHIG